MSDQSERERRDKTPELSSRQANVRHVEGRRGGREWGTSTSRRYSKMEDFKDDRNHRGKKEDGLHELTRRVLHRYTSKATEKEVSLRRTVLGNGLQTVAKSDQKGV